MCPLLPYPSQDMAQPMDPLRLKGTMLDARKVADRNLDKTGKEQRDPSEVAKGAPRGRVDAMIE